VAIRIRRAVTNDGASTIFLMPVRSSPPRGRCRADRCSLFEKDDFERFKREPPAEPVLSVAYGYLTVRDTNDREVRLMFCHRCGAMVRPRGEHVHTNWHRSIEHGSA